MTIVYGAATVLSLILLLLLAAIFHALFLKAKPLPPEPAIDSGNFSQSLAERMSALLQCKTISLGTGAADEEKSEFTRFRWVLKRQYPKCFSAMEDIDLGNGAMLLRLRGIREKGGAVVLMSHHDVVPAPGKWRYPPFSGTIAEGAVWGRGAVDTKGSLCAIFEAIESLLSEGFVSNTDIFISSSNAEEIMGDGAERAAAYLEKNQIPVALVTDEGGRLYDNPMPGAKGRFAMVSITEKGYGTLRFTAKSNGGHAAAAKRGGNPLVRLAGFITEVERHSPFVKEISPELRQTFKAIAPYMKFPFRLLFGNLWLFRPLILYVLPRVSTQAGAMLATTCVFTRASGSDADNVIPETASITANLRFIHHQPMRESIETIRAAAKKHGIETEVIKCGDCSPVVDTRGAGFRFVSGCIKEKFPESAVVPMTLVAGTDARNYTGICRNVIRFVPLIMSERQLISVHGTDENVTITSLSRAVDFYKSMLIKLNDEDLQSWVGLPGLI
jgi:carboxypeptidase PM20D1